MRRSHPTVHAILYRVGTIAAVAMVVAFLAHDVGMALDTPVRDLSPAPELAVASTADAGSHDDPARDCHADDHAAQAIAQDRFESSVTLPYAELSRVWLCDAPGLAPQPPAPPSAIQRRALLQVFLN